MALKDNSPTLSYVAWSDLLITYEGTTYKIQNSYTNMKYIYWDITNPYTLQCFNKTQQQAPGMRQVFINDNGMGTQRTHEDIVMTWDGNNNDLIASQIFALHESNKVTGNKFVAIETDIEGVRQTVGETNTELGKVSERVSQIKQQADDINISVSELNKTFTDTQEVLELRENLNKSIITLNSSVGLFKSEFSSYYKNNLIDSQEQVKINTHLDVLDNNKLDLLKYIAIVETIIKEEGQTSQVIVLNSAKDQLSNSIDNIRTYTLGAISDGTIVPSEITFITNLFSKVSIAINELKNVCDDCIFLGAGGKISEELAKISIKSDEIILSVSNAEEAIKSNLGVEKNLLQGNIKDFRLGMEDLNKSIDSLSKDGVVDNTDKTIINNKILEIESEKNDIVNKYNELSTSELISPSNKSELDIEFNKFIEKYNSMVNTIHSVTTDEFFNDYEKMQVENLINETLICLSNLHPVLSQAIDNVQLNTQKKEVSEMKNELNGNIADVENKVVELNTYVNTTFEDNVLDETERKNISNNLDILTREKVDIDNQFSQLNSNKFLDGILKINYGTSYNNLVKYYGDIVIIVNNILDKKALINDSDRSSLSNAYLKFNEELANFVKLSNEVINYISKKEAEHVKSLLDKDIEDVGSKIDTLEGDINTTFKDNILDETERKDISNNLEDLRAKKIDVDGQYNHLIDNPLLSIDLKNRFKESYDTLINIYNNLVETMEYIINKSGLINESDRTRLDKDKNDFNISIANFSKSANEVLENIGANFTESSFNQLSDKLDDLNVQVDNIVEDLRDFTADGIIDNAEKLAIEQNIKVVETEFAKNEVEYNNIYNSTNLNSSQKDALRTSFNAYKSKYQNLINIISNILSMKEFITDENRDLLNTAYSEYNYAIKDYLLVVYNSIDIINNKNIADAKTELNEDITNISNSLNNLSNTMNGVFKDGLLSDSEKLAIKQTLEAIEIEKIDIDRGYESIYNNSNLIGNDKTNLYNAYGKYVVDHNSLIDVINEILNKNSILNESDQSNIATSLVKYKNSLSEYKVRYNLAVDSISNKNIADAKTEMQNNINEVSSALNGLEDTMNGAFKDGLLSDSEKLAIKQNLQIISKEKADVDEQYLSIYNNVDLIGDAKTNFKLVYDSYCTAYTDVVSVIDGILNKVGLIDSSDKDLLDSKFKNYSNCSGDYSKAVNDAIDNISNTKAARTEEEAKKFTEAQIKIVNDAISLKVSKSEIDETIDSKIDLAKAEIKITTDEITQQVSQKIGKDNVISTINQSAESIKINASKINLSGYVTVTNLKTSGSTTINGGNITTGTIDASLANITNINASNITSGTINTSLVKIKGSTTKKIVMGNDNYCVYDGTETDANRKIFMGFRRHSDTISVPSIILGSNGVNPNVDGAVISGGTYTTYSHYKNNDNPEGIDQSYGALAFKYNAGSNDICTLNMYQDGKVGLQAGSSVYLRAGKATNSTAQLVIQSDSVLSRKPFSCSSTIYSTGNITTAGALNVTGAITGNSTLSVGAITGKSTIKASGQISTTSTIYASNSITSNAGIYANTEIKATRAYADEFFIKDNSQQIFKHLYTNWMANGCNWDWQEHYLNDAVLVGCVIEMNTVEDDIKSLDLNDLDTIKQIKFREITKYNGDTEECIDISDVTNRDEITSGRSVDLIKLVHLLVKEVQYLKMRMNGE